MFANPHYLYLLLLIPLFIALYIYECFKSNKQLKALGEKKMILALMPRHSTARKHIKFSLLMLALATAIAMLARPQYGMKSQTDTTHGIEVVVMVDVSNSMLATDIMPSRLDRAKLLVTDMVSNIKNDKVALGVFAGEAYPQFPITSDYASAKTFIDALSTDMVTLQGTNLAEAINLGCKSFSNNKEVGKAILLITDGEDHEPGAEDAAKAAYKAGINVFVMGVGTTQGGEIPTANGPLKDVNGQVVHTSLNEQMCKEVAQAGHGVYLHLDQSSAAKDELQNQLQHLKKVTSSTSYVARNEQFQAVAIILLILLILETCLNETKNTYLQRFKFFGK